MDSRLLCKWARDKLSNILSLVPKSFPLVIAVMILSFSFMPRIFAQQTIPGEQLTAMATDKIEEVLENRGEFRRHEIDFSRSLSPISLPNGVIDIQMLINTINYSGVTPVKARISVGGRTYRDVNFAAYVRVYDTVLIANHDLRIDAPVKDSDFRTDEIQINGRNEYIKEYREIAGLVPRKFVRAGSPVAADYFRQVVAVQSQSTVKIIARSGNLWVSAQGTALTRGRIGDIIKVRNESSKKVLSARVIDSQTVEVVF